MRTFVINLKKDTQKRKDIQDSFDSKQIPFEFFNAVDGKTLSKYPVNLNWYDPWYNYHITCGEVGCALSHVGIWEKMIEENIEKALIFEDDIDILNDDGIESTHMGHISTSPDFISNSIPNKTEYYLHFYNDDYISNKLNAEVVRPNDNFTNVMSVQRLLVI